MEVHFTRDKKVTLLDKDDNIIAVAERSSDKSYSLRIKANKQRHTASSTKSDEVSRNSSNNNDIRKASLSKTDEVNRWHERLGHCGPARLYKFLKVNNIIKNITFEECCKTRCEVCMLCKSKECCHRDLNGRKRSNRAYQYLHMDIQVVGEPSYGGHRYALIIVDDYTRMKHAYTMISKGDTVRQLEKFFQEVIRPQKFKVESVEYYTTSVQALLSDNAKEFLSYEMQQLAKKYGYSIKKSPVYSSESNGTAERAIQTIAQTARCLRIAAKLPLRAWAEMYHTAVYLDNHLMTSSNEDKRAPLAVLLNKDTLNVQHLRTIGSDCYVHNNSHKKGLEPSARKGRLIGYSENYPKHYRVLMDEETGEVLESPHVTFNEVINSSVISASIVDDSESESSDDEVIPTYRQVLEQSTNSRGEISASTVVESTVTRTSIAENENSDIEAGTVSDLLAEELSEKRQRKPNPRYFNKEVVNKVKAYSAKLPYKEAVQNPLLKASIKKELTELIKEKIFEVVDRPKDRKPITSTWVHKIVDNGSRGKSRWCPRGYQQIVNKDYNEAEVAAPTLHLQTMMIMLAMQVIYSLYTKIVDVIGAFRIPKLAEKVYIELPEGMKQDSSKVLLLNNSLYGLKQAAHHWAKEVKTTFLENNYSASNVDCCLYISNDKSTQCGTYVDDIKVLSKTKEGLDNATQMLEEAFPVQYKDQNTYLGIQIIHSRDSGIMTIDQEVKIEELLKEYKMEDCKPVSTPAEFNTKLIKSVTEDKKEAYPYRELVGSLLWLARASRPDIMYAVNQLCKFVDNPSAVHIIAAKRVLRYLKGTKGIKLILKRPSNINKPITVKIFVDADFAREPEGNKNPMKSTTGIVVTIESVGTIFSQCQLQTVVAKSTCEAEYIAISTAGSMSQSIKQIFEELNIPTEIVLILNDNQSAITIANSEFSSSKLRHVKVHFHYVKELIKQNQIKVSYVPTTDNIADIMTKALSKDKFQKIRGLMGFTTEDNTYQLEEGVSETDLLISNN